LEVLEGRLTPSGGLPEVEAPALTTATVEVLHHYPLAPSSGPKVEDTLLTSTTTTTVTTTLTPSTGTVTPVAACGTTSPSK
jgi:hypothetical protein